MSKKRFSLLTALTGLSIESEGKEEQADATDALIEKLAAKARTQGQPGMEVAVEEAVSAAPVPSSTPEPISVPATASEPTGSQAEARQERLAAMQEAMDFILEEVNQKGPDFAEFMERLDAIRTLAAGTNMDEARIYQLAHLEFKGQVSRRHLLTTAKAYQQALKTSFFERAKSRLQKAFAAEVKGAKEEANRLRASNVEMESEIRRMQEKIVQNLQTALELEGKAGQQEAVLQHKKAAYEFAIPAIMAQIDEVAQKIESFLPPDEHEKAAATDLPA